MYELANVRNPLNRCSSYLFKMCKNALTYTHASTCHQKVHSNCNTCLHDCEHTHVLTCECIMTQTHCNNARPLSWEPSILSQWGTYLLNACFVIIFSDFHMLYSESGNIHPLPFCLNYITLKLIWQIIIFYPFLKTVWIVPDFTNCRCLWISL